MNTRLEQFLAAENISQSQLADTLGVARASISHILAGRNKPGYEFMTNLMRSYPALNIEWLLLGKGKMYKGPAADNSLNKNELSPVIEEPEETPPSLFDKPESEPETACPPTVTHPEDNTAHPLEDRKIVKIIAFYSDGTFSELS